MGRRVLILFSDTGGGHRAAARAIEEALAEVDPEVAVSMRDGLVEGTLWPLNRSPRHYNWAMAHARWLYALTFHAWNGPLRSRLMVDLAYPLAVRRLGRLLAEERPDVVVSVHPLLTHAVWRLLRRIGSGAPLVVVVTDLVSGHWSWFEPRAQLTLVPTEECRERVVGRVIPADRLVVTGQPVHPRCGPVVARRDELRERFGWSGTVILMTGGGDGMGDLGSHVRATAAARLPARLVVVCGRNEALRRSLEQEDWPVPLEVHGFVDNLHELMAAADVLVSKGGPGSIAEGCVAGLPILIYDRLPGQESGNVRLVEERGIGRYVPRPDDLVAALGSWLDDPAARARAGERARALGRPDSARAIAEALLGEV